MTKATSTTRLATVDAGLRGRSAERRLAALKATIDQAKLKREIVLRTIRRYRDAGLEIRTRLSTAQRRPTSCCCEASNDFGYTFDANDLTAAIKRSYELQLDLQEHQPSDPLPPAGLLGRAGNAVPNRRTVRAAASLLPLP